MDKESWLYTSLKELCGKISSGGTPSRKNPDFFQGDILWVKSKELKDINIYDTEEKITNEGLTKSSAKMYQPNTILIAMYGANIGQLGILKKEASINQAICALQIDDTKAYYKFIYYYLLTTRWKFKSLAFGAAQQNLNQDIIGNFPVKLSRNIDIQVSIAEILSNFDNLIENNCRRIKILEEIAVLIYHEWFVKYHFPGYEEVSLVDSGTDFGRIPEGWEVRELNQISEITDCLHSKKPQKQDSGKLYLQVYNIGVNGKMDLAKQYYITDKDYRKWISRVEIKEGDILITKVGRVGHIALVPNNVKAAIGRNLVCIRSNTQIVFPSYLKEYFLSNRMQNEIKIKMNLGTILESLHVKQIKKLRIILPSHDVLLKFDNFVSQVHKLIYKYQNQNAVLYKCRELLLPKLISGQIDVSEMTIKIDEEEKDV